MSINDFSSIIEVLIALNFAFVTFDGFEELISKSYSNLHNKIEQTLDRLEGKLYVYETEIDSMIISITDSTKNEKLKSIQLENATYNTEFKRLKAESKTIESKMTFKPQSYSPFCLLSGLVCLASLFICPVIKDNHITILLNFLSIYIAYSAFIIILNGMENFSKNYKPRGYDFHDHILHVTLVFKRLIISIYVFIIISLSIIITSLTHYNIFPNSLLSKFENPSLTIWLIPITLIILNLHHVFYFIMIVRKKNKNVKKYYDDLTNFRNKYRKQVTSIVDKLIYSEVQNKKIWETLNQGSK